MLAIGSVFFLLLAGMIFFAHRYPNNLKIFYLPILFIIGATAFDGTLIGFQFITLHQKCLICISVAASLLLLSLLYSISLRRWLVVLACFSAWSAGFLASATIIMPDVTKAATGMIFYERPVKSSSNPPQATLIFSMTCPHCKRVLEYLAEENPLDIEWRFAITDKKEAVISKLGFFYKNAATSPNPFKLLLEAKKKKSSHLADSVLAKLAPLTRRTRIFLSNNDINEVPVLVYKQNKGEQTIIVGSGRIINFLKKLRGSK